jgi:hypothetical protein
MGYWDKRAAAKQNLRMFEPPKLWRRYADEMDGDSIKVRGCAQTLDTALNNGLNSTNLIVLTGAGASFSIKNPKSKKTAPSWSDLWAAVKENVGEAKFNAIIAKIPRGNSINNIEKLLTQCKLFVALYGSNEGDGKEIGEFLPQAEAAILARVDFVDESTEVTAHETLLRKIARRGIRKPRARIFTTNYDLCFEYAARRHRFIVIDGFSHAAPPTYDRSHFTLDIVRRGEKTEAPDYLDSVFHLYKLHGSMDWRRVTPEIIRSRGVEGTPVLIYPRDSKYQEAFDPPFLDMMAAFQASLGEPDTTLIVAGFGFNDSHIAQPVISALETNMTFRLVVCDPAFVPEAALADDPMIVDHNDAAVTNAFHQSLVRLGQIGDQRLLLLSGRFEDLVEAIPDLVAETERERHAARIKVLREADLKQDGPFAP